LKKEQDWAGRMIFGDSHTRPSGEFQVVSSRTEWRFPTTGQVV
jgi:hypothetical protein